MCYLRKLFFSGIGLCQGMFLSFLLSGFLQEGTQQWTPFQGSIWSCACFGVCLCVMAHILQGHSPQTTPKGVFFSGSRLCQDMSLYTAADFPSRHNLAQWISLLDRRMFKPILDPLKLQPSYACTGDYYKSHGPYHVGPSFTITPLKGFLTHDGGISDVTSSLQVSWEPLIALHATSRCLG